MPVILSATTLLLIYIDEHVLEFWRMNLSSAHFHTASENELLRLGSHLHWQLWTVCWALYSVQLPHRFDGSTMRSDRDVRLTCRSSVAAPKHPKYKAASTQRQVILFMFLASDCFRAILFAVLEQKIGTQVHTKAAVWCIVVLTVCLLLNL